ncbi:MAG: type II toxin-antitoxin system RelE/ParE family toxin [Acidobacteriota bacterium]
MFWKVLLILCRLYATLAMDLEKYEIRAYVAPDGRVPVEDWLRQLRDKVTRERVYARLNLLRLGNFGDCRSLGGGVRELRIHHGPGFRIYFGVPRPGTVMLLTGGSKKNQRKDIDIARRMWSEVRNAYEEF